MHIKLLYRKVLYVFLSLMIVISSTQSVYAATSTGGWTAVDTIIAGATTTINATKNAASGALKSAITIAPQAGKVGKYLLRGGAAGALAMAVPQLLGEGIDWVLDPANNRVRYIDPSVAGDGDDGFDYVGRGGIVYPSKSAACSAGMGMGDLNGFTLEGNRVVNSTIFCYGKSPSGSTVNLFAITQKPRSATGTNPSDSNYKYLPIDTVAAKVISNAEAGHGSSQEAVKATALEGFAAGEHDNALDAAAQPATDTDTGTENPPTTDPNNPPQVPPFDPSSIIAAIQSVMAAIVNMSGIFAGKIDALMVDMGLKHEQKIAADAANTGEIVAANDRTGAKVAEMVAAIEAIEGNMLTGEVINDAIDRVISNDDAKVGDIVAAIEAIEGNTLDGQVINDAIDRVIANDNANAQSAADAASQAASDAAAADVANTTAVTDAIDAQTDAITTTDPTTGEKSLKLPAFCGFAPVVCEYIDWVKGEYQTMSDFVKAEPEVMPDEPVVVADDPSGLGGIFQDKAEAGYVSFSRECPADVLIPVSLMGASQSLNISYTPFCHFASLIRPAVILGAWISGLLIISGGRARE